MPSALRPLLSLHLPDFELIIYDLGRLDLDQLAAQPRSPLTVAALLALWFAPRDRDPERFLARWINPLRAMWRAQRDREAFDALVYYLTIPARASRTPRSTGWPPSKTSQR